MSQTISQDKGFPRIPLFSAAALIGFALSIALFGRLAGIGLPEAMGRVTAERTLQFADRADGAVIVTDISTGKLLDVLTGENGFLRGTLRGFARTRRADQIGALAPFRVTGYQDGRLTLSDPSTGRVVELEAFGSANEAVFVRLLTMKLPTQPEPDMRRQGPG